MKRFLYPLLLLGCLCWPGCGGTARTAETAGAARAAARGDVDLITVEGRVTLRGPRAENVVMLETDQHNLYILVLEEVDGRALRANLPGRFRITGSLFLNEWDGKTFTHLRPVSLECL
jgi:hypothetical protein